MPRIENKKQQKGKGSKKISKKAVTIIWSIASALLVAVIVVVIVLGVKAYNEDQEIDLLDSTNPDTYLVDYQAAKTDEVLLADLISDNNEVIVFAYHGGSDFDGADEDGDDDEIALFEAQTEFNALIVQAKLLYDTAEGQSGIIIRFINLDVADNLSYLTDVSVDTSATCTLVYYKDGTSMITAENPNNDKDIFEITAGTNYNTTKAAIRNAIDYLAVRE